MVPYCHLCLASVFPFNNLCDELEFKNCIFNLSHSVNFSSNYLCQLSLTSKQLGSDLDINPDYNLIRQYCKDSPYYLDNELDDSIDENNLTECDFSLLHINARSLQNKLGKLPELLNSIKIKFSIIAISETWSNEVNDCFLNIPGYVRHLKSRSNRTGGGVALFIHDNLPFTIRI